MGYGRLECSDPRACKAKASIGCPAQWGGTKAGKLLPPEGVGVVSLFPPPRAADPIGA